MRPQGPALPLRHPLVQRRPLLYLLLRHPLQYHRKRRRRQRNLPLVPVVARRAPGA
jgi:hypothetical protein